VEKQLKIIKEFLIINIIIFFFITLYDILELREKSKKEYENFYFIYSKINNLKYNKTNQYLNNNLSIKSGIIPNDMKISGNFIYNTFNGKVTIKETKNEFIIKSEKIPTTEICFNLIYSQRYVGWDYYVVNSNIKSLKNIKKSSLIKNCNLVKDDINISFIKSKI
jgi:hypothetical protein